MVWKWWIRTSPFEPGAASLACRRVWFFLFVLIGIQATSKLALAADPTSLADFQKTAKPVLNQYCSKCHNADLNEGGVAFDADANSLLKNEDLWLKTLKVLRAG